MLILAFPFMISAQFQGEIQMSTSSSTTKENATMSWLLKDGKHAMNIQSTSGENKMTYGLIIDERKGQVWFLSDIQNSKAAYAIPYAQLQKNELNLPLNSVVKDMGASEKIAGFDCQKYQIISSAYIVDCWVSNETGITHSDFPSFMSTGDLLGLLKLNKINGIPMKFEVKNTSDELVLGQSINKIIAKDIKNSQLEVPSDYTQNKGASK